jgi:hypothetical protein
MFSWRDVSAGGEDDVRAGDLVRALAVLAVHEPTVPVRSQTNDGRRAPADAAGIDRVAYGLQRCTLLGGLLVRQHRPQRPAGNPASVDDRDGPPDIGRGQRDPDARRSAADYDDVNGISILGSRRRGPGRLPHGGRLAHAGHDP